VGGLSSQYTGDGDGDGDDDESQLSEVLLTRPCGWSRYPVCSPQIEAPVKLHQTLRTARR